MLISVKSLVQIGFYALIIGALVVINLNQLNLTKAQESGPISSPITSPVTPTPEPTNPPANNPGPENHDNHDNGPSVCGDQKPGTPVLLSVIKTGPNQVKLSWSKPAGPVTAYTLNYGLTPTKMLYGDPSVGNTNSYVVNQLQNKTTYYFQVRAANGCTPGDASNTLGINASGKVLGTVSKPAVNGTSKIKSTVFSKVNTTSKPQPSVTPRVNTTQENPAPVQQVSPVENNTPKNLLNDIVFKVIRFFYR